MAIKIIGKKFNCMMELQQFRVWFATSLFWWKKRKWKWLTNQLSFLLLLYEQKLVFFLKIQDHFVINNRPNLYNYGLALIRLTVDLVLLFSSARVLRLTLSWCFKWQRLLLFLSTIWTSLTSFKLDSFNFTLLFDWLRLDSSATFMRQ